MTLKQRKVKRLIIKKEIKSKSPKKNPKKKSKKKKNQLQQTEEKLNVFSLKSIQFHWWLLSQMEDTIMIQPIWLPLNIDFILLKLIELFVLLILARDNILKWSLLLLERQGGWQLKELIIWALELFWDRTRKSSQPERVLLLNFLIYWMKLMRRHLLNLKVEKKNQNK